MNSKTKYISTQTECIKILFQKIDVSKITIEYVRQCNTINDTYSIDKETFMQAARHHLEKKHITLDEMEQFYYHLNDKLSKEKPYSILDLIADLAKEMLEQNEYSPLCKYSHIFHWRDLSYPLGQDLLTTAFLSKNDYVTNQKSLFFGWSPIIRTNNQRLNNILKKGLADNHSHLNGSSQIFTLNWVCLMNHITNRSQEFDSIKNYLFEHTDNNSNSHTTKSLHEICIEAALYRVYLFYILHTPVKDERDEYLHIFEEMMNAPTILSKTAEIQRNIKAIGYNFGYRHNKHVLDYALTTDMMPLNDNDQRILAGERKFLYDCYYASFSGHFNAFEQNLFFKYLCIRTQFRNEFVQVNAIDGFKNFSQYQDRKVLFINSHRAYWHEFVRIAVNSNFTSQSLKSLEARIVPSNTPEKLYNKIMDYERIVFSKQFEESLPNENEYFYVLHFLKRNETRIIQKNRPRNLSKRLEVEQQTRAIYKLLEQKPEMRRRIRGIDAASAEIGCPPEVFAIGYRTLLNRNYETRRIPNEMKQFPVKLRATYHVGEDFLDIASGLRAIDEVLLYLNFRRGHRLGHALALGIHPQSYYSLKRYTIRMPKQELLDNIVWVIEKCKEYGIKLNDGLRTMLERKYKQLFSTIYMNALADITKITTIDYFYAWMLRGDKPELYKLIYENQNGNDMFIEEIERIRQFPLQTDEKFYINEFVDDTIRFHPIYQELYYAYHFNDNVKQRGIEIDELTVDIEYAKIIEQLQDHMIKKLSKKGIAIECNPSSNYLIGTILHYDEHPIFRFNSFRLENQKYPLSVSINTDDAGVFDTLLENEYALMAKALEEMKDEDGNEKYNIEEVYSYIDYIRNLGLEQSFQYD